MTREFSSLAFLTDEELTTRIHALAAAERGSTVALVVSLVEFDARRLYLGQGYPSLHVFCAKALHLSDDAAYNRIRAARVAAKWPIVLDRLADGSLTLTAIRVLSDVLTDTNHLELFEAARHKSKREVERLVAPLKPEGSLLPRALVTAVGSELYRVELIIDEQTHAGLRRLQDLLRHQIPSGDPGLVVARAIFSLIDQLERKKWARTDAPRSSASAPSKTRHIAAVVRRAVWTRDGARCTFVGTAGRCPERGFLEFHHAVPFADGGQTTVANLELRCRAHNQYEAEEWFGPRLRRDETGVRT